MIRCERDILRRVDSRSDWNGPVWSGLEVKPDQTNCLHDRSGLTGKTSKTAKDEAEAVEGRRKAVSCITSVVVWIPPLA
jgi:hypothetical protein